MIDLSKFLDWLKLPTKTFVALCLASAVLLFSPSSFLASLGLDSFVGSYRPYLGATFVLSFAISAVSLVPSMVSSVLKSIRPRVEEFFGIRRGRKRLQELNPEEKKLLSHFILNETRSQNLPIQSGVVSALEREKILIRASRFGKNHGFDYNIQPWAWEYLNKNKQLLE